MEANLRKKLLYVKKNWQLYVFFLTPALLVTIIFRYIPMGGILMAFKDYNVRLGILGSDGSASIILSGFFPHRIFCPTFSTP